MVFREQRATAKHDQSSMPGEFYIGIITVLLALYSFALNFRLLMAKKFKVSEPVYVQYNLLGKLYIINSSQEYY